MKLIEVKIAKEFASTFFSDPILKWAVNKVLDNAPCFELVRCKDCKHWEEAFGTDGKLGYCAMSVNQHGGFAIWYPDDFCSYGERKDNDCT